MNFNELQQAKQFSVNNSSIEESLLQGGSWEARYRNLMLLGKKLSPLPQSIMVDANKVMGCESNVWLAHYVEDNRNYFLIGSDSKIVKGLIVVLLSQLNSQTSEFIHSFNLGEYLEHLKLNNQLSASRTNGLNAICDQIVRIAQ